MLKINAEAAAGDSIHTTATEMQQLADRLGVSIEVNFNGVTLWAYQGGSDKRLAASYMEQIRSETKFKFASSR